MSLQCKVCGPVTSFDVIAEGKQIKLCEHGNEAGSGTNVHAYNLETGQLHCKKGGFAVQITNIASDIRNQMLACTTDCKHAKEGGLHACIPGAKCNH